MSLITNLITREPKKKLRILTFPTHERYESNLAATGHDFYSFHVDGMKKWESDNRPDNYFILPPNILYPSSGYDLILAQSRFNQFQLANQINQTLEIPIICLEHTVPTPELDQEKRLSMGSMEGHVNVFISKYSEQAWKQYGVNHNNTIITHCVDTDIFKPIEVEEKFGVLTVANNFKRRDYCLNYRGWEKITAGFPFKLVGVENEGCESFSDPNDLALEYNKCAVYLNTTTFSTVPMSLLEAMSCGCVVVSTDTCAISEFIKDGYNGFISNDETVLKNHIRELLTNKNIAKTIGENARQTIVDLCSKKYFADKWNNVFMRTYEESL